MLRYLQLCALYQNFVNTTQRLYPNPTGLLRKSVALNLHNFYLPVQAGGETPDSCPEQFPFGNVYP